MRESQVHNCSTYKVCMIEGTTGTTSITVCALEAFCVHVEELCVWCQDNLSPCCEVMLVGYATCTDDHGASLAGRN
jgi:hypothetical protein